MDRSGPVWPVMVSAVLLSGAIAAAVAAATLRYGVEPPPRIAVVRLAEITAAWTTRAAAEGRTAEDVRDWGVALEAALDRVAQSSWRHVLLPARAVAAGAPDLTNEGRGGARRTARAAERRDNRSGAGRRQVSAGRAAVDRRAGDARRRHVALAVMVALAGLWLLCASRVHVNASWSDGAWGYAAFPLFGEDPAVGDRVVFEPPEALGAAAPYLKTVLGVPGMRVDVDWDGTVFLDGVALGRAKTHALDGRPLAAIAPGVIPAGHYYLHADHADSHDSRYAEVGLVPRGRILGRAVALPDLPWLGLDGPLVGPEDMGGDAAAEARP